MNNQWQNLPAEQQEMLGAMEADRIKTRYHLLEQAHGSRKPLWGALFFVVAVCASFLVLAAPAQRFLAFPFLFAVLLIHYHVACLNRRLDAFFELLQEQLRTVPAPPSGRAAKE